MMESEIFLRAIDPDWLTTEDPYSLLERVIVAEYLLSRGYLMAELETKSHLATYNLKRKACRYAETKIAEIENQDIVQRKFRLPILLN